MTHGHPRLAIHQGVAIHLSGHQHLFSSGKTENHRQETESKKEKELQ
jgi:hypothetical protein